ncbi:MAG: pilus assembly protein [Lachnospiraceae bacterium]|nr:pilus assembly protein [Lachnospiraceae bacterium]
MKKTRQKSKWKKRGSMTIEAALALPVFLFAVINIISAVELICLDVRLEAGLSEIGREMANYAYVFDALQQVNESNQEEIPEEGHALIEKAQSLLLAQGYARTALVEKVGREYLDHSMVVGGAEGIWLWRSSVLEEGDEIDLILSYRIKPRFGMGLTHGMQFVKRCCIHAFTGYIPTPENSENEELYYITKGSQVYHVTPSCTHLKLSISAVLFEELEKCRNMDGSRYKKCDFCIGEDMECEVVYIALQGDKYHSTLACSGLKRTVYVIKRSQLGGRRKCMRCG